MCFLHGASRPVIVRPWADYFSVIVVAPDVDPTKPPPASAETAGLDCLFV